MLGEPFGGFDQVRNQVVAPLQLVFNLCPLRLDRFFLLDERVVGTAAERKRGERDHRQLKQTPSRDSHVSILPTGAAATAATSAAAESTEPAAEAATSAAGAAEAATEAAAELT